MIDKIISRENGALSDHNFRVSASSVSSGLIHRLRKQQELTAHAGCVNTVTFSPDGEQLLSGSDDLQIVIWDWKAGMI
jgi:DDB1- and CUL4-associated factor 8